MTSNLIKLQVGRCLTAPHTEDSNKVRFFRLFFILHEIFTQSYRHTDINIIQTFHTSLKLESGSRFIIHGSGFSVWFSIQDIIQNTTCSVWYIIQSIFENTTCSVWFRIQGIIQNTNCSVWFIIQGIIRKRPGYYSAYGSGFRVLFKTRPAASGSVFSVLFKIRAAASGTSFRVLLKNGQDIIQRMVQYSEYF